MNEKEVWAISPGAFGTALGCLNLFWLIFRHFQEKRRRASQDREMKIEAEIEDLKEQLAKAELLRITPSGERLRELAKSHPPPQSWYDEDMTGMW
jgi:hypothetical protein